MAIYRGEGNRSTFDNQAIPKSRSRIGMRPIGLGSQMQRLNSLERIGVDFMPAVGQRHKTFQSHGPNELNSLEKIFEVNSKNKIVDSSTSELFKELKNDMMIKNKQ